MAKIGKVILTGAKKMKMTVLLALQDLLMDLAVFGKDNSKMVWFMALLDVAAGVRIV